MATGYIDGKETLAKLSALFNVNTGIGYLLSFGAYVEIIEPTYLKAVLAAQAQEFYQKNKP